MKWWYGLLVLALIGGGYWLYIYLTAPIPGQEVKDMGREHVTPEQVAQTTYNSNPPTSGPHLETWVKPGIYSEPQHEGELIHSLEHGYIIISYNCNVHLKVISDKQEVISKIYAHEEEGSPSAALELPPEATGSATNETEGCKNLVKQLEDLAKKKRLWKLIVVPRPELDTTIALTAWTYIDTFDQFDAKRIERFIDYHRDHGPEKTME